jgi:hypothetical protein
MTDAREPPSSAAWRSPGLEIKISRSYRCVREWFDVAYVADRICLSPHPKELMLDNV